MKKKLIIIMVAIFVISIIGHSVYPYFLPIKSGIVWNDYKVTEEEEILYNFVTKKLTTESGGIKTNYINLESEGDITKGHSFLSESQGMMLLYYLDRNEQDLFDKNLILIENKMLLENGLISWRVEGDTPSRTSATIDDLRIIKALLLANERWGNLKYRSLAINISKGIKKELVDKNVLLDFNDGNSMSKITTLCYLDLPTLKLLSKIDNDYKKIYNKSLDILNNGYLGDTVPLYKKEYYRSSDEYDNGDIDTLLSVIVLLNRAEVGEEVEKSVEWLKSKFREDNGIYSLYSGITGEKMSDIESTSIYSILLQLSAQIQDSELLSMCLYKLKIYQVTDKESEIYGSYGNSKTLDVYSFDNLNALLAYRKVNGDN